jgi:hypothetical protein
MRFNDIQFERSVLFLANLANPLRSLCARNRHSFSIRFQQRFPLVGHMQGVHSDRPARLTHTAHRLQMLRLWTGAMFQSISWRRIIGDSRTSTQNLGASICQLSLHIQFGICLAASRS